MCYVFLACQLPLSYKLLIMWPLKHNCAAQLIKHCTNSGIPKAVPEVVCIPQVFRHFFLETSVSFPVKGIPKEYGSMAIPATMIVASLEARYSTLLERTLICSNLVI
ncbi:uncharacterized protein DS421_9g273160 [Arachis hypogaea]|nr:uncharacterized protein DS421_9g273160 [Arachis hypogaea]